MKYFLIIFLSLFLAAGCNQEKVRKAATDKSSTTDAKQIFSAKVKAEIETAEKDIASLEAKIKTEAVKKVIANTQDRIISDAKYNLDRAKEAVTRSDFEAAANYAKAAKNFAIDSISQINNALNSAVSKPVKESPQPAKEAVVVEADNKGFYPSSITVKRGANVSLTIRVRPSNVPAEGLSFGGPAFITPRLLPGQSFTAEFTAQKSSVASSYNPEWTVKKADLIIVVK